MERMIQIARATKYLNLTLNANESRVVKWWKDAAHTAHSYMKIHNVGAMTIRKCIACSYWVNETLHTSRSREAGLVSANDVIPHVFWTTYFLQTQVFRVMDRILYQDNQSVMLFKKNVKCLSRKLTHHINITFFVITDMIAAANITIKHCTTDNMTGDFLTKGLRRNSWKHFAILF